MEKKSHNIDVYASVFYLILLVGVLQGIELKAFLQGCGRKARNLWHKYLLLLLIIYLSLEYKK